MSAKKYVAFVDPSGGSSDSFTLAIAHAEEKKVVLDGCWERVPPFSPKGVAGDFAETVLRYGITRVMGDRYAGEWPREPFRDRGITYVLSDKTKSEIYAAFLVLANSGQVEIPLHRRLIAQFRRLERRVARGGRESVDHAPGGRDDLANAAAGAMVLAVEAARKERQPLIEVLRIPLVGSSGTPGNVDPFDNYGFDRRRGPSFGRGGGW